MVTLEVNAQMRCDADGCSQSAPVVLCLAGTGGFVFKPRTANQGWQVGLGAGGMGGPFVTRCPEHKQTVAPVRPAIQEVR